jgi:hypothetical protein
MTTIDDQLAALDRLVKIAKGSSGQCARVANFLLAWWNARRDGGFDFTDLWNVDETIREDMIVVFALAGRSWAYPDKFGYQADFEALVTQWRGERRRKQS